MFKNTLLTIAFTFCFIIFSVGNSFAQKTIQTQRISKQLIPNLGHALNDYQVFSYDIAIKNLSLKTNDEITLDIAGQKFDFRIFTDNLQIIGLESDERIFLGGQSSNGGQVSLTLADDFIYGYIERGGTKYYIQPLSYFTSEATTGQYVLFDAKDIVEDHKEHVCGDHTKTRVKSHALNKSQTSGCKVINMAIANTNDMLVKYGSTAAVQNHNLAVLNNVQSDFRSEFNFNLEFNVTAIYIAPDTNSEPFETDPNNGNADEMLTQFIFWASDGSGSVPGGTMGGFQTALDMGVLWSARDMVLNGEPVVGLANTPGWFHLLKDFSAIPSRLQALMSHEIGHNLGAIHDPAGSNTIMAPSTHTTINWSAASVADVDSYVAALTSLSNCSTLGTPVAAIGQTTTVVCQGSMLTLEDQSAYGETRTWSAANQTFSDPTCAKQTITFNDLGYNIIDLTSINGAGQDETATYVKVEAEPFSTCDPSSTTGTGGINKITFENINHESALANVSGSYENNICAGIANVEANTSYDVFIDVTAVNYMNFYFDFNGDGDFDDLNESGSNFQTTNDGNYLVNLSMPADPNLNEILRMRVIVSNTTIPNACYTPSIGQVEDYGLFFATPQVLGCTNPASSNYNSFATVDDGSCATVNTLTFYQDSDSDGYGNPLVTIEATTAPSGYVADNTDCNDSDDTVNPGVPEICDGSDNNCNNTIDEGLATTIYYLDSDSDGYGDAAVSITDCTQPTGYVLDATDCDDSDATIYPNATELCDGIDNDCNGTIDDNTNSTVFYLDSDSDGYGDANVSITDCTQPTGYVLDATDCDDSDANIYPNATEICDGIDNDCNGTIDDNTSATTFYLDSDSDGYGDAAVSITDCTQPSGYVLDATDCDDSDATIYPNATEICDGIDNDCNGTIDDNTSATTFYLDSDSDGYGDAAVSITDCIQPTGYVLDATDCDDSDATIYPNATELCDGLDNDCNGTIDDNINSITFYLDSDNDGYGDFNNSISDCAQPTGYVLDGTDCDDSDATIYPNATELCDGIDNDCNGSIDESTAIYYLDNDGDGFGNAEIFIQACEQPDGYVPDADDCDDNNNTIYPSAPELCDDIDNNCNGIIDDEATAVIFYYDADNDGYGDTQYRISSCEQPSGYVLNDNDCNDNDASIFPNAEEICDGVDNNCDGIIDENYITYFLDNDGDGFGDAENSIEECDQPIGYVLNGDDCDDNNATTNPMAEELCDGIDNNCDGVIEANINCNSIEGYIFNDRNLNGIKDFNEIGIQGIRVNLIQVLRSSSNESSVTDQDGYYLFSDLEPGEYLVEIDLSGLDDQYVVVFNNDELSMGENNRIISYPISVDGDTHLVAPISYYQGGTVTGRIYFDSLSLPVQTWVFIYDITDPFTKIDSIQTLENGSYGFEGIAEGEYFLSFMAPLETTFILNGDDDDPNVISTTYVAPDDVTTIGLSEPFTVVASGVYNNMNAILSNANSEVLGLKDLTKLSAVWDQESNGVELTWSYDQVLQVREILIERKHESETVFSQIKSLDEITNIYLDQSALSGINYYKVTLILEHNEVRYSQMAAVRIAAENEIMSIYPNPSDDYTYIKSRNMASKVKSLTMYDRSGALLQIPNLEVLTEDLIRLDLTGMPSGVYYLRIRDQSTSKTQKLVILD